MGLMPVLGKDLLPSVVPDTAWNAIAVCGCCYLLLSAGDEAPNRFGERVDPDAPATAAEAKQATNDAENAALRRELQRVKSELATAQAMQSERVAHPVD